MSKCKTSFFVGDDFITSDLMFVSELAICPIVGELVEIRDGDKRPIMLPVRQVKHTLIDGLQEIDVLLYDEVASTARHNEAWVASLRDESARR